MAFLVNLVVLLSLFQVCFCARKLATVVHQSPLVLTYHNGLLLQGDRAVSIVWYGGFTSSQRSVILDFFTSLDEQEKIFSPSVSQWWDITKRYMFKAGKLNCTVSLGKQILDEGCSMGKSLKRAQINEIAAKAAAANGMTLVLTSTDVTVEGFCMSSCGFHGSAPLSSNERFAYIWVGNSETQCPGQCAWPFHQPFYGPQTPPLEAPNGDVGVDGMIINIAAMMAGTVTNPFGNGYFQGPPSAPLEAVSACPGMYGKGAYPGYAGELLVDSNTGASYNAHGLSGRKYLLPAMWDPQTSSCFTLS